jgi:hypothetical protein
MSLQQLFKKHLDEQSPQIIAKQLGYCTTDKITARIESMINSRYLDLDKSGFDLRYSTPNLIRKLAEVFAIHPLLCDKVIEEIEAELLAKRKRFKPYIFIETNFKRISQPVCILAALQSNRFLAVDEVIWTQPLNEQLELIQEQIKAHYHQQPVIDVWGEVKQYAYYYEENLVLIFSITGQLLSTETDYFYSKATLSI